MPSPTSGLKAAQGKGRVGADIVLTQRVHVGIWYIVYSIWHILDGIWYIVYGIWYIVYGI